MRKFVGILLVGLLSLTACRWSHAPKEEATARIKVLRFDRLQYDFVVMNSVAAIQKMNTEYPQATKLLIEDVLALGEVDEHTIDNRLKTFFSDTILLHLMSDVQQQYKQLDDVEKQLNHGFGRLKKEVPALVIPRFYAQISALNQSIVVSDSILGFSLDKYMGADYPLYKRYYYPYQSGSMRRDRIVPDCMTFYLLSMYPMPSESPRTLIDFMMHRGVINWVMGKMLGFENAEDAMGYDKTDAAWCRKNRNKLWRYMVEKKHFYTTDPLIIRTYISHDPYVNIMSDNTPVNIGIWMGVKLVERYVQKHPGIKIEELLRLQDYHAMFEEAKYPV